MKKLLFTAVTIAAVGYFGYQGFNSVKQHSTESLRVEGNNRITDEERDYTDYMSQPANIPPALDIGKQFSAPEDFSFVASDLERHGGKTASIYMNKSEYFIRVETIGIEEAEDFADVRIGGAHSLVWESPSSLLFISRTGAGIGRSAHLYRLNIQTGIVENIRADLDPMDILIGYLEGDAYLARTDGPSFTFTAIPTEPQRTVVTYAWRPWADESLDIRQFGERTGLRIESMQQRPGTSEVMFVVNVADKDRLNPIVSLNMKTFEFRTDGPYHGYVLEPHKVESFSWNTAGDKLWVKTAAGDLFSVTKSEVREIATSKSSFSIISGSNEGVLLLGLKTVPLGLTNSEYDEQYSGRTFRTFWLPI